MRKGFRWGLQLILSLTVVAVHSQTLLTEDFNGSDPPGGWLKFNNSSGGTPALAAWTLQPDGYTYSSFFVDPPRTFHSNDNSQFYISNSDAQGSGASFTETILQSPSFSTSGYSFISLSFYHHFREYLFDTGYVEVSTNGTSWTTEAKIFTADQEDSIGAANAFASNVINLSAYGNNPTVWIRFRYYAEFGYYWALDNVLVEGSNITPVTLVSFSGYRAGNRNLLKWTTASEQNNLGFGIERSADGINYSSIGFVQSLAPSGNSVSSLDYFYSDNNLAGSKQYYRLRQADFDGHQKLSNVILIRGDNPAILSISFFPNPASNNINVLINAPHPDHIVLRITDAIGRLVNQKNAVIEKGSNNINIDLAGLMNGTYFLKVIAESGTETLSGKFIKQ